MFPQNKSVISADDKRTREENDLGGSPNPTKIALRGLIEIYNLKQAY
jgi:hypothetical protein